MIPLRGLLAFGCVYQALASAYFVWALALQRALPLWAHVLMLSVFCLVLLLAWRLPQKAQALGADALSLRLLRLLETLTKASGLILALSLAAGWLR